jgi:hypothetical protein
MIALFDLLLLLVLVIVIFPLLPVGLFFSSEVSKRLDYKDTSLFIDLPLLFSTIAS